MDGAGVPDGLTVRDLCDLSYVVRLDRLAPEDRDTFDEWLLSDLGPEVSPEMAELKSVLGVA